MRWWAIAALALLPLASSSTTAGSTDVCGDPHYNLDDLCSDPTLPHGISPGPGCGSNEACDAGGPLCQGPDFYVACLDNLEWCTDHETFCGYVPCDGMTASCQPPTLWFCDAYVRICADPAPPTFDPAACFHVVSTCPSLEAPPMSPPDGPESPVPPAGPDPGLPGAPHLPEGPSPRGPGPQKPSPDTRTAEPTAVVEELRHFGAPTIIVNRGEPVRPRTDGTPLPDAKASTAAVAVSQASAPTFPLSGALVGSTAVLAVAGYVLREFLAALFVRISPHRVLEQPRRRRLLGIIRDEPGIEVFTLAARSGMRRSVVRHHLAVLGRAGLVRLHRIGGRSACFSIEAGRTVRPEGVALLRRATTSDLVRVLQSAPGLGQRDLSRQLGVSQQRVSVLLRNLEAAQLVRTQTDGRARRYFAGAAVPSIPRPVRENGPSQAG